MIFHYSYISVKNKSNNRTQISATEYRRNKIKRLLKKTRHNSKTRQNRDNTHENDKKDGSGTSGRMASGISGSMMELKKEHIQIQQNQKELNNIKL
jgi:hypothetical protein